MTQILQNFNLNQTPCPMTNGYSTNAIVNRATSFEDYPIPEYLRRSRHLQIVMLVAVVRFLVCCGPTALPLPSGIVQ